MCTRLASTGPSLSKGMRVLSYVVDANGIVGIFRGLWHFAFGRTTAARAMERRRGNFG